MRAALVIRAVPAIVPGSGFEASAPRFRYSIASMNRWKPGVTLAPACFFLR